MTKNPFYNALFAIAYIVSLITIIFNASNILGGPQESILFPIGGLSLFVLSAALMAYLFFYQPVLMLIDGEREKAVKLFLHTLGIFACGTALIYILSIIVNSM